MSSAFCGEGWLVEGAADSSGEAITEKVPATEWQLQELVCCL